MKKVLIIEDDLSIAELERDYLESNNFEVSIETTGNGGLNNALSNHYSLIIIDIMLPHMDGFNVCKELRKTKQTPIIFVSAKIDDFDKIRGLGLGADDYIVKPFSPLELVARVNAHIKRYEQLIEIKIPRDEIEIRGLKIGISAHTVHIHDREVNLSNMEFELLSFLARNPGTVYSKEKLLNEVWGYDAFIEMNTVAVHINRIREKIEKDPSNPEYILTVWGVGYKMTI